MTIQRIVRRGSGHGAGGFTDFDGDVLTVGQGHHNWRTGDWRAHGRGVGDRATFRSGFGRGQFHRRGVDGVGDFGHGRDGARHQVFEIAASGTGDADFDFAGVFVDVISWRWNGHGASGFAGFDGDDGAVAQRHGHRGACRVGQGRGVDDRTAFSDGASGAQRQVGGVDSVGHGGADRGFVRYEVFVVAARHASDRVGQRFMTVQRIVRRGGGHGAGGFAYFDGDGLTVGQGYGHWRTGDRRAHCGGISDCAALGHRGIGGQFDGRSVDGIGHFGNGWNSARNEVLEVAAGRILDGHFNLAGILVDVIGWCWNRYGASGFTGFDGDDGAVAQRHGHRGAGRIGQGRGVDDRTAFGHGAGRSQRQVGGVDGVSDGGADRSLVGDEVFVVAAAHVSDRVGQWFMTVQRIVRRGGGHGAGGLAHFDGDGLAVGQGHDHRRTGHGCTDGSGVSDGAAFGHRGIGGQFDGRGVDSVGNFGHGRHGARHQVFEIAAGGAGDADFNFAGVFVDVIGRGRNGHGASGFAGLDGDHRAVAQRHGHRGAGRIGQGRGVNNRTTFSDGASGAQRQVGDVDGVGDGGADRSFVRYEVFVVATGHASDRVAQRRLAVQHVVRCGGGDGASSFAHFDGDGLAVGQGHDHRRTGHGCTDGSGVSDGAAFGDRGIGGQFDGRGVDGVGDFGHGRHGARHQVFEIAAVGTGDADFNLAGVFVDVIGRGWNGHGASGFAGFDGDDGAVAQGHGHRGASRIGQGCGVNDRTAFSHGTGGAQRQVGGVDGVSDGGGGWRRVRHQVLEVAAGRTGNRGADGAAIVVDVVRRGRHVDGAGGLAGSDGDGRAIGQGDGHRRLRRVGQGGGVGDLATFDHRAGSGESQSGGVARINDIRYGWGRVRHQVFEIATGSTSDGGADGAAVVIDVIRRGRHVDGAGGLAGFDGDGRAVGQSDGHRRLCRVGQRRGVGDLAAFGDAVASGQGNGSGVNGVGDLGRRRSGRRSHGDAVAASSAGDGHVDLGRVVINGVVRCQRHVDGAGGGAGRNHDHRAVGQGDGQVGERRLGQGRGVHQHAAGFGDGRRGAEAQGRLTQGVGGGVGGLAAGDVLRRLGAGVDTRSREADGRVDAARRGIEHHETMATTGSTASACGGRAGSGGVERGSRVGTGGDGLLQLGYRRRGLRGGFCQVSAGVGRVGAPLGFAAQVQGAAIRQFQRHGTRQTGVDLVADEQAIAFNEHAAYTLRGNHEYLTDNAFDDGNNTAH